MRTCDTCDGSGQVQALVCVRLGDDQTTSQLREMACAPCDGTGEVSEDAVVRRGKGRLLRSGRLLRGHTFRDVAALMECPAVLVSRLERGLASVDTIEEFRERYERTEEAL